MNIYGIFKSVAVLAAVITLAGCQADDSDNNSTEEPTAPETNLFKTFTVDASSYSDWAYYDLDSQSVVTVDDGWDLAFKRFEVIVNDSVRTALVAEQSEYYDSEGEPNATVFMNANVEDELEHLIAETDFTALTFEAPIVEEIIGADDDGTTFYDYDFMTHKATANDDSVWVVRSNTGQAYAKLRPVMLYDADTAAYEEAVFELYIQSAGEAAFAATAETWTVPLMNESGSGCYDIDSASSVACDEADWDLNLNFMPSARVISLTVNGGVSGPGLAGVAGVYDYADSANLVSGIQDPEGDDFDISRFSYLSDSQINSISDHSWYAYNVNGRHGIWPNYRIYAIDTGIQTYKVQLVNYYNTTADSGHITVRYVD